MIGGGTSAGTLPMQDSKTRLAPAGTLDCLRGDMKMHRHDSAQITAGKALAPLPAMIHKSDNEAGPDHE
ncbi:hypothetical protein SAOR_09055 [Salinisphaera orenii MK-B5]|uniref:Uncharacterized protein n=2 Tax=Salinisphaera orenii TaxID=856731 RepID=A0A423PNJ3_9GAMM|nr:hypothetical protein SAHL_15145 [Salinisphaera halophila YIM 95161]ROO27173.1 hypothetical protein SAOR_09055 [Salinisphaera orenii MK-B5]